MADALRELPKYTCHKQVWALKIKEVENRNKSGCILHFEEDGYAPIALPDNWYDKHTPKAGGYYVVYDADYASYSPADVFEKGYTLTQPLTLAK